MTNDGKVSVRVLSDLEAISRQAASIFRDSSRSCITSKRKFVVAISGGTTPVRLFTLLGSAEYSNDIDWNHVHFFWVDERCVPKEDDAGNFKAAFDSLLSQVPVPEDNIHRMRGEDGAEKGARDYEGDIKRFFGAMGLPVFDLIILGVGEDGHTASLLPDSSSLAERERLAIPVHLEGAGPDRITLSLPVLNNAAHIIFLVSGMSKSNILRDILSNKIKRERYPAGFIHPANGIVTWLLDKGAAGYSGDTILISSR